jgi:uncharacterized tellurite resistance protein B-like protein
MGEEVTTLDTRLVMAASLIYMSSIDGTIAQQEWGQLKTVVGGDDDLLEAGLDYVRDTPLDKFLADAPALLNREQRKCVLLNVYDSLLSDGTIEPEEESLFDKFLDKFEFTRESIKNELDALFVKNNTKVLGI